MSGEARGVKFFFFFFYRSHPPRRRKLNRLPLWMPDADLCANVGGSELLPKLLIMFRGRRRGKLCQIAAAKCGPRCENCTAKENWVLLKRNSSDGGGRQEMMLNEEFFAIVTEDNPKDWLLFFFQGNV